MIASAFATLLLASTAAAQVLTDPALLVGTWASGSKKVLTGPGFANPANGTFIYPPVGGVSYSFTDDNHFEIARYRFISNGAEPNCIKAVINWSHGTYTIASNGSIVTSALDDGFQQVQDPCAPVSNFVETYNLTEVYNYYQIFYDQAIGEYKLHLFMFDGSPVAPLFHVSKEPNMLPKENLRNRTISASNAPQNGNGNAQTNSKRSVDSNSARENNALGVVSFVGAAVLAGLTSFLA